MRSDVHFAALKAAAKVAFSVALLNGCSNAAAEGADDDKAASNESAVESSGEKKASPEKPCPSEGDAGPAKPSCEAVLAAAFPKNDAGFPSWTADPSVPSKDVAACCDEELATNEFMSEYRSQCCSLQGWRGGACTPWGPPVPPSMKRARRANPEVAAWIAKAVA